MRSVPRARPPFAGTSWLLALSASLLVGLTACATKPPASDPEALADFEQTNDPLEPTNRVFYAINNGIDTVIFRPLAQAYRYVLPGAVRQGIHNVISNIATPGQLTNDMLQGKPRRAGDTAMRFLINTTVGVLGVFDVAKRWGYPDHDADFGMTMATWGVPEGPFLFLPILGPTDPRDAVGFGINIAIDPFTWVGGPNDTGWTVFKWTRYGLNAVDTRERVLDSLDQIKKTALDPYATFRSLYRQHRHAQIEEMRNDHGATVPVWFPRAANESSK